MQAFLLQERMFPVKFLVVGVIDHTTTNYECDYSLSSCGKIQLFKHCNYKFGLLVYFPFLLLINTRSLFKTLVKKKIKQAIRDL